MRAEDFEKLRDYILEKNPYLHTGFANAYKDAEVQSVVSKSGKDMKCLFPIATQGSYFYLRNETSVKHEAAYEERLTDTGAQRLTFRDTTTAYLVVIARNADAYALMENMKNTVMMYPGMTVQPIASTWNREQAMKEEMAGMKKESVSTALKRLKDETIVKITLSISKIFIPGNCISEI